MNKLMLIRKISTKHTNYAVVDSRSLEIIFTLKLRKRNNPWWSPNEKDSRLTRKKNTQMLSHSLKRQMWNVSSSSSFFAEILFLKGYFPELVDDNKRLWVGPFWPPKHPKNWSGFFLENLRVWNLTQISCFCWKVSLKGPIFPRHCHL